MEIIIRGIKMSLIKVNKNENPYHIIGEYIEKHITYVDDIIAVISLDGNIINELFLVEITTESNFIWQRDWWEGEENVELIDFFFVSDACKRCDNNDLISRQTAIDAVEFGITYAKKINKETGEVTVLFEKSNAELEKAIDRIKQLPPAQPKRGKWILKSYRWECDQCGCLIRRVNPFKGNEWNYNFCPNCGAEMRGKKDG